MPTTKKSQAIDGTESMHYRSQRKNRKLSSAKAQPPLTPMIDVVFQLLTFFVLTMQFIAPEGQIPANLPAEDGLQSVSQVALENIIVNMRVDASDNVIMEIEGQQTAITSFGELYSVLRAAAEQYDTTASPVVIKPRPRVPWGPVVNAYNQARRAQFEIVGFAPISAN